MHLTLANFTRQSHHFIKPLKVNNQFGQEVCILFIQNDTSHFLSYAVWSSMPFQKQHVASREVNSTPSFFFFSLILFKQDSSQRKTPSWCDHGVWRRPFISINQQRQKDSFAPGYLLHLVCLYVFRFFLSVPGLLSDGAVGLMVLDWDSTWC